MAKRSLKANAVLAAVLYTIACLSSSYYGLFSFLPDCAAVRGIRTAAAFLNRYAPPYLSFCNGFVFFLLGRVFARKEIVFKRKTRCILLILCFVCAYGELFVTTYFSLNVATDCYFMLVPLSAVLFLSVKSVALQPHAAYLHLRRWSAFLYLYHFVFLQVFYRLVYAFGWTFFIADPFTTLLVYLAIVFSARIACKALLALSEKRGLAFLKYCV